MKYRFLFVALVLLLISPVLVLAADINLTEGSGEEGKIVEVTVDTKAEPTNSLKVVIQISENINVSKVVRGDYPCGTFSSTQNGSKIEITCTTKDEALISSSIAKINFTSASDDYSLTILEDESQIGQLTIENTVSIGQGEVRAETDSTFDTDTNLDIDTTEEMDTSTSTDTNTEGTDKTTFQETTPTTTPAANTTKEKKFTDYLPYVLLSIAGVLLVSIIILLVTKGKKEDAITADPSTAHVTQPPIPTPPVEIPDEKPTLQEMVNAEPTVTPTTEETTITSTPVGDHDKDLEALLMSENPSMAASVTPPVETPVVTAETTAMPETVAEVPNVTTDAIVTPEIPDMGASTNMNLDNQEYVANTSEGGLPSIGFTSPTEVPTQEETTISQPVVEIPEQMTPNITETPTTSIPTNTNINTQELVTDTSEGGAPAGFLYPEVPMQEETTVSQPVTGIPEQMAPNMTETPITTLPTNTNLNSQEFVANTSEGGLPSAGFTSPTTEVPTQAETTVSQPIVDITEQVPTNTPTGTPMNSDDVYSNLYETPTTTPNTTPEVLPSQEQAAVDLQALVNNEVNNIQTAQQPIAPDTTAPTETATAAGI